jgi:SAM-dependent methyltransferase
MSLQEFYDHLALDDRRVLHLPRSRVALELVSRIKTHDILDLGCGEGDVSIALHELTGSRVVGIDISEVVVERVRKRGMEAHRVVVGDEPLPFADSAFDLVFMAEVLEHLHHPDRAVTEIARILRPEGHLLITTPNLACLPNRFLLAIGLQPLFSEVSEVKVLGRGSAGLGDGGEPVGHVRLFTKGALIQFLSLHGFEMVALRGVASGNPKFDLLQRAASWNSGTAMIFVALARKRAAQE